jgi:transcriptional regulator with XRE-family HTH domain
MNDAAHWKRFGKWIERERRKKRPSMIAAARAGGMSRSNWDNLEKGGRNSKGVWQVPTPGEGTLLGIAAGLDTDPISVYERAGIDAPDWLIESSAEERMAIARRSVSEAEADDLVGLGELIDQAQALLAEVGRRVRGEPK